MQETALLITTPLPISVDTSILDLSSLYSELGWWNSSLSYFFLQDHIVSYSQEQQRLSAKWQQKMYCFKSSCPEPDHDKRQVQTSVLRQIVVTGIGQKTAYWTPGTCHDLIAYCTTTYFLYVYKRTGQYKQNKYCIK